MITALQLVGLATITLGVMLLSVPVGLIVAGLALTATGYALGLQQ
jgi:hypothetical protein